MDDAHLINTTTKAKATLLQSGENLALLNPELFLGKYNHEFPSSLYVHFMQHADVWSTDISLENERLRSKLIRSVKPPFKGAFIRFPKFPREIRDMIYLEAALDTEARVIEVIRKRNKYRSQSLVPALLHACKESRAAARKVYSQLPNFGHVRIHDKTYVNWEKDIIFFRSAAYFELFAGPDFQAAKPHCRNLAIMWSDKEFLTQAGWRGLENVERLFMVRQIVDNTQEKSGLLMLREVSDGYIPDLAHFLVRPVSVPSAAASFLARSRHNTLALNECVVVDLFRDGKFKRKINSKKAEDERTRQREETEVHEEFAQSSLLAAQ
jgi:hypothetical protein